MTADLYAALDVPRDAPPDAIRRAYRRAAKRTHPDAGGTRESFALVTTAQDVLLNAQRRARYDATGEIEEKAADQTEAVALNIALNAIDQVLAEIARQHLRFEEFDVVADAAKTLDQHQRLLADKIAWLRRDGERLRSIARRFGARGGDNRIGKMFEARVGDLGLKIVRDEQAAVTRAIEILKEHKFRSDAPVWGF
jgi:curved DNA-binding protein CbpA